MPTVNEVARIIKRTASLFPYIRDIRIVSKTLHTIKAQLEITDECFMQIYRNVQKDLISYTLVLGEARIFGRNCDGGVWHRHPADNPGRHNFSKEGSKPVDLQTFLLEVEEILLKLELI